MTKEKLGDVQAALAAGRLQAEIQEVDGLPLTFSADGQVQSLENCKLTPQRVRGNIALNTPDSMIEYCKMYGDPDGTVFFANLDENKLTLVLNHHKAHDKPGWKDHRAVLRLVHSIEWENWSSHHKYGFNQEGFARFLEENSVNIKEPASADIIEIARNMQATKKAKFEQATNLQNGSVAFAWKEDVRGTVKNGKLEIPESFFIAIAPYRESALFEIELKLRYHISSDRLEIWYEMLNRNKILQAAFESVVTNIKDNAGVPLFYGSL